MTAALYACIGALSWVAGVMRFADPRHYIGPSIEVKEDVPETELESEPGSE